MTQYLAQLAWLVNTIYYFIYRPVQKFMHKPLLIGGETHLHSARLRVNIAGYPALCIPLFCQPERLRTGYQYDPSNSSPLRRSTINIIPFTVGYSVYFKIPDSGSHGTGVLSLARQSVSSK